MDVRQGLPVVELRDGDDFTTATTSRRRRLHDDDDGATTHATTGYVTFLKRKLIATATMTFGYVVYFLTIPNYYHQLDSKDSSMPRNAITAF